MRIWLIAALAVAASAPSAAAAAPAATGRLLVGFEKGVSKERQDRILSAAEGRLAQRFSAIRGGRLVLVRPRSGKDTGPLGGRLRAADGVAYAEPDFTLEASASKTPDDPFYTADYGLVEQPDDHDIDAPEAWGTRTGCGKVAILDTGIDTDHPDLKGNLHKSSDKPNNNKDDDKNGFVDDTYGYNAIAGEGSGEDDEGHGTHVAGIVAAKGNNSEGISGICWSAKLLAVKFMNSRGTGSTSNAIEGIEYAVKAGAKVINCSFGSSSKSSALKDAVEFAQEKKTLLVVASGNSDENIDKKPSYPASYDDKNILAVAASTSDDKLASFSNFGSEDVDVAAPGENIFSTYVGGGYKVVSGTSMAAPLAAGLASMLRKHASDATPADLRKAIRKKVDKPPPLENKVAHDGRINARKALGAIKSIVND
ncbi:MAG: S8 family peptidase [Thermoleophilaceae bacterium]